mmetsp:Transcript_26377/g.41257  ORF Transcript_26377/g.41257 Transcript_26377/m.41257 type:complete len:87 (-) Transcript_26377:56-316(-)
MSAAGVLLLWGFSRGVILIPKSVTPRRIRDNFDTFLGFTNGTLSLTPSVRADIDSLDRGYRYLTAERFLLPNETIEGFWAEADLGP